MKSSYCCLYNLSSSQKHSAWIRTQVLWLQEFLPQGTLDELEVLHSAMYEEKRVNVSHLEEFSQYF